MFYFIVFRPADLQSNLLIDFLQSFTLCEFAAITVLFWGGSMIILHGDYILKIAEILQCISCIYYFGVFFVNQSFFCINALKISIFHTNIRVEWQDGTCDGKNPWVGLSWANGTLFSQLWSCSIDSHGNTDEGPSTLYILCSFSIHYLFIWKCTPFSWASQKCHLREMASSEKLRVKNQSLWDKNITDEDLIWKTDIVCYYSYSTSFVEV